MKNTIGDKIRILRTMKGYSQKGLAMSAGLTQENISYIEQNKMKKEINPEKLNLIATALGLKPEDIQNFDPEKIVINQFQDNASIFIQNLAIHNQDKIIALQKETIDTLQQLNELYKSKLQ